MGERGRFLQAGLAAIVIGLWIGLTLIANAETSQVPQLIGNAVPQLIGELQVGRMEICSSIVNKEPQGSAAKFKAGAVSRLYCYTEIVGAKQPTYITHTWYYKNKPMVSIKLAVETTHWRNWSNKTILPEYKGDWRVEVTGPDGKALKSVEFILE